MELERLKEKRKGLRISFTKHLTKIETTLGKEIAAGYTKEAKLDELLSLKSQLTEKLNELIKTDESVQLKIEISEMAAEIASSEEYKDKGIDLKSKLQRQIELLCDRPQINTSSQSTDNTDTIILSRNETKSVKLPKLNIQTFHGDCSHFLDFWNSFEVAIHKNDSLTKIEKFTYLKTYLGGIALNAVSGFSLSDQNYDASIKLLKERFGRTDIIISSHMHKLLLIDSVKSCFNVTGLRKMYDAIETQIRSLQSLGVATGTYSNLLCPVILQKLPEELNLNYNRQRKTDELFDITNLVEFIRKEVECREASLLLANPKNSNVKEYSFRNKTDQGYQNRYHYSNTKRNDLGTKSSAAVLATQVDENNSYYHKHESNRKFNPKRNFNPSSADRLMSNQKCIFCLQNHMSHDCSQSVYEKKKSLMAKGKCFICFQNHIRKFCNSNYQKCKYCGSFSHNSLICENEQSESKNISAPVEAGNLIPRENGNSTATMVSLSAKENKRKNSVSGSILLQTFSALVKTKPGKNIQLRCMLDGGANKSFILREVVELLDLKVINKEALAIYTFGSETAEKRIYDIVEITLQNVQRTTRNIKIQAVVIDSITSAKIRIPSQFIRNIALEKGIELADNSTSERIYVLIGSDYISEILGERNIRISKRLIAADSIFGYLLQGKEEEIDGKDISANHLIAENEELDFDRVKDLWLLETIGINSDKEVSMSDKEILKSFEQNTTYTNKRYETRLLWKEDSKELNSNYEIAKRRLFSLNKTLEKNKELFSKYDNIIREHLRDGIVERVEMNLDQNINTGYFLPHHAVVREQKDSTKVRIVFDASSKSKGALSLNDCLESGPKLNPDLLKIILRFRLHKIAFCADIQRAFLEVGIAKEDREFLKFLWIKKEGPNLDLSTHNIETLRYKRVTFGVKCSPFLLAAIIRLHLEKYEKKYAKACEMLNELYVDDLINGTSDITEAIQLSSEMIYILSEASMNLRRWATNSPILNEVWKRANVDCRETSEELGVPLKILGIIWDNMNDNLTFDIKQFEKLRNLEVVTKRIILSTQGMLFDPIGIMNPFTVRMKLLLQTIWELGIPWDECVPSEIKATFIEWLNEIEVLRKFEIPRLYFNEVNWESVELHLFSDASPKCYGSVAYFRIKYAARYVTSFIMSKSRLAPLKKLTLPRLELLGALISARMGHYLQDTFPMLKRENIFYWSDSQICIHWIKGKADDWKQFVRNRVSEIKEKTNPNRWHHCAGKFNPADKLTRGISAHALVNDEIWFSGPPWLLQINVPYNKSSDVGIDFAGPIYTRNTDKAYIALFTCAVTRAIHLEVVSSLSTEHFLLAFRRFISRRGICHTVNSDNAMTFKSADIELKRLYMNICEPEVQNYFGKKGIKWQYIVERAAWWGGYWERMVQITKIALRKILGRALVSFEELQTILAEIEAIINSRPLTYVYNEPNEPFPLTPANFLTGRRLTALPNWSGKRNIELFKGKKELIKRYLYREKILNNFWKRWKREYLLQLKGANLNKNVNVKTEFNVNDIVLIGEEKVPRQLWKLGKVIDVHKGRDSKVRSATIKTSTGIIKRPIQLLYNLEIVSNE
ncbi:hypothetical protein AVEN_17925-1 [Araneus ventricosus]|uniref:Integrase catalytic domain-containing protein n=2 Tax=Araneus ventricosus TaxID=182803 RepID=A0A4Y2FZU7_ARAVE|nr:hypothetical protein AVEN_17925-1 [Araneus ventricosus]